MKILVYPKDSNPYQNLLYSKFPESDEILYLQHKMWTHLSSLLFLPFQIIFYRLNGFRLFHLHWLYTFRFKSNLRLFHSYPFKLSMTVYCMFILTLIKLFGYKLIWTAHDLIPHGDYFINNLFVTRFLSRFADVIIVHSKYSIVPMKKMGIDTKKVQIVRIGNYIGLYKNKISTDTARQKLELPKDDLIFGMFGKIEEYKGVLDLISSFIRLKLPHSTLLIAGICPDLDLKRQINDLSKDKKNIKLFLSFINDSDVQRYINSANILVYPFKNITTSSSVILAMSFGKPVICPQMGDLAELPNDTGIYYNESDKAGLQNSMRKAYSQRSNLKTLGENAYKYIKLLDWVTISQRTHNIYKSLIKI